MTTQEAIDIVNEGTQSCDMPDRDAVLTAIFGKVGKEYGFTKVSAEFAAFKDFKMRWQRSYNWADFKTSDYLIDAPDDVLEAFADYIFSRIVGNDAVYSTIVTDYFCSPDFVENHQNLFLKRSKNLSRSHIGEHCDLNDSYQRLIDAELVVADPAVHICWAKGSNVRKVGGCSVLMKVASVSSMLDTDMIPDFVRDYVLYHELCHLIIGFDPGQKGNADKIQNLIDKYPKKDEAEEWMKRLVVYV